MDSKKMIDIASLPMAESVNSDDTLLLMRQGENGANELMRVEKATLTPAPAKKRVKRYVIGRAISLGSVHDPGHENWYCYGFTPVGGDITFIPIRCVKVNGEELRYTEGLDALEHVYINGYEMRRKDSFRELDEINSYSIDIKDGFNITGLMVRNGLSGNDYDLYGQAFRVVKYEGDASYPTAIWLESKAILRNETIHSDSTHHSIENARRVWKTNVDRKYLYICDYIIKCGTIGKFNFDNVKEVTARAYFLLVRNAHHGNTIRTDVLVVMNKALRSKNLYVKGHFLGNQGKNIYRKKFVRLHSGNESFGYARINVPSGSKEKKNIIRLMPVNIFGRKDEAIDIVLRIQKADDGEFFVKWEKRM